jgi:hypothetical protein
MKPPNNTPINKKINELFCTILSITILLSKKIKAPSKI